MENIATDTYSFSDLRQGKFVYVDKTEILYTLVSGTVGKQFFISRPRRFGKSLAISTLQCLFEGRRDLFCGLKIEPKWDWSKTWPVIRLDMGSCQAESVAEFRSKVNDRLTNVVTDLGLTEEPSNTVDSRFLNVCRAAAAKSPDGKFVLLVDEYDKPLLSHLGQKDVEEIRSALKSFYSVIKTCEGIQRFAFITGVSKFSKVSLFSDLNNLNDFSMDARVGTLFGYTHGEALANFPESLAALGQAQGWTVAQAFEKLAKWYDGYRFHEASERVFNPVSVGKSLSAREIKPYWFETGTPTFLLDLLAESPLNIANVEIPETSFSVYEPAHPALLPLLYQTGYLTIQSARWEGEDHIYTLGLPNQEVSKAFNEALAKRFSYLSDYDQASLLSQMVGALRKDDVNDMLDALSCFFANIPANITLKKEKYYQSLFYAVFVLIGARTHAECWTNRGRIDAMVETPAGITVFEFKLHDTAQSALAQIKAKGYGEKYRRAGQKLTLVGVAFDATERNLSDRAIEVV